MLPRMWELRQNVPLASGYDAASIAAAETFDHPLITGDARLPQQRYASAYLVSAAGSSASL
ncbi:hypothetical protein [Streptomyces formicae]|uniref:PIN domain-containing protein n=1 Tax=Streptomyces formicae TaxID=1616117 RepID=A0ABY3WS11_9ACTN|nr:hypothetical protein [Streptomyces formicae]UNM15433.1 hypothetical protein J4032_31765 [Streptomyces formicae]